MARLSANTAVGSAVFLMEGGQRIELGRVIDFQMDMERGPGVRIPSVLDLVEMELPGEPLINVRLQARGWTSGEPDILTEAACLADDLERAGNDWGAEVVRRLAGLTGPPSP
jgi:hypothetical protein